MSVSAVVLGILGLLFSAGLGRLAFYMWGKRTRQAEAVEAERDDLERQLEAEQETPRDPKGIADDIRHGDRF